MLALIFYLLEEGVFLLLTCLLVLLVLLPVVAEGTSEDVCHQDYYLNTSHPQANKPALGSHNSNCVPCSTCIPGQGIQTHCLNTTDTKCQACTHGYYSQYSASFNNRFCTVCTNCSTLNRIEVTECTPLEDTVCGKCSKGYFLSVNYDGSTNCVKCSYCPSDKNVVRWYECADLPDNQQCAPGYSIPPSTSPPPSPVTSPSQEWDDLLAELKNHSRHGFISIPNQGILTSDEPPLDLELVVSFVSILFTVATLSVFLCAVGCFVKKRCNKHRRRHIVRVVTAMA